MNDGLDVLGDHLPTRGVSGMAGYDYTYAERMRRMRQKRRDEGLVEVRERVPSDLVSDLKRIAAEMRNPETAEE